MSRYSEGYTRPELLKPDFFEGETGRKDGIRETSGAPSKSACSLLSAEENCQHGADFHMLGSRGGGRVLP